MSERREFNAPSAEEALDKAAVTLSLDRSALSYEVIDEGSSGFLGLGVRDARVVVELPPASEEPDPVLPAGEESGPLPARERQPEDTNEQGEMADSSESEAAPEAEHESASEAFLEGLRSQVENTLEAMAFDGEVHVRDAGEVVVADIESEDAGLLIGQKGETIDAVQYLVNVAIYQTHPYSKKVVLDCEGYRERRIKAVQGMAHRTAKRVLRERKAVDLPPMSPSERKAVHSYLKDNPKLSTRSTGDDESRHVTIYPAE